MLTVMCVLRSGGIYTPEWVRKLKDAVGRNLSRPHRFVCISDVEVPCERIVPDVDWPGWWLKIFMFKQGVITGDTLYLDLDTAITGPLDGLTNLDSDFAMLQNFSSPDFVGSGVMWFRKVPTKVYERFLKQPKAFMEHYERARNGSYIGDQAFIADTVGLDKIDRITDLFAGIRCYKYHCKTKLPPGTSIVCFQGVPKCTDVKDEWLLEAWH